MGLFNNTLTEREKAALYYHIFTGCNDWKELYILACDQPAKEARQDVYLANYASRWHNSQKVKDFLSQQRDLKAIKENKEREQIERELRDSVRNETQPEKRQTNFIDYSDPANRKQLYNQVIATAKDDPKTQLDAAKMFEQIQRDDRAAAAENKQVRAYLPITCDACPLYQVRRKKTVTL